MQDIDGYIAYYTFKTPTVSPSFLLQGVFFPIAWKQTVGTSLWTPHRIAFAEARIFVEQANGGQPRAIPLLPKEGHLAVAKLR